MSVLADDLLVHFVIGVGRRALLLSRRFYRGVVDESALFGLLLRRPTSVFGVEITGRAERVGVRLFRADARFVRLLAAALLVGLAAVALRDRLALPFLIRAVTRLPLSLSLLLIRLLPGLLRRLLAALLRLGLAAVTRVRPPRFGLALAGLLPLCRLAVVIIRRPRLSVALAPVVSLWIFCHCV